MTSYHGGCYIKALPVYDLLKRLQQRRVGLKLRTEKSTGQRREWTQKGYQSINQSIIQTTLFIPAGQFLLQHQVT